MVLLFKIVLISLTDHEIKFPKEDYKTFYSEYVFVKCSKHLALNKDLSEFANRER